MNRGSSVFLCTVRYGRSAFTGHSHVVNCVVYCSYVRSYTLIAVYAKPSFAKKTTNGSRVDSVVGTADY